MCSGSGWPRWWSSWPSCCGLDEGGLAPAVCVPATQLDPARLASAQDNLGNLPRDLPWDASAPARSLSKQAKTFVNQRTH